jgi:cytochrome b561
MKTAFSGEWKYARPAVFLHWTLALLIAGLLALGWYMMTIEHEPGGAWYIGIHKSFGILVFGLVAVRVLWRATHRPAPLPAPLPAWQVRLSRLTHWGLYLCMVLMPVLGFMGGVYSKSGVAFFGLPLMAGVARSHATAEFFFGLHSALAWLLVALIAVHAAAGLKHLLVDRDRVFQRMWF